MRRLLVPLALLMAVAGLRAEDQPRPASADVIALFREALKNSQQDIEHWAYTETTVIHASKGRPQGETMVRFDPSKPYAEQFTPLLVKGKKPTERQLKEYRKRGEKRGEKVARAAEAVRNPGGQPPQMRIGRDHVALDPEHPLFVNQEGDRITLEVPVQGRQKDIPVEKLQILVVINQASRLVESATLRVRESFRVKLIAKVKVGEARLDFTVVDPKFAPVITSMTGNFGLSVFFVPLNATISNTRTDWQRVKSYDERLQVKLGPLQLLDF